MLYSFITRYVSISIGAMIVEASKTLVSLLHFGIPKITLYNYDFPFSTAFNFTFSTISFPSSILFVVRQFCHCSSQHSMNPNMPGNPKQIALFKSILFRVGSVVVTTCPKIVCKPSQRNAKTNSVQKKRFCQAVLVCRVRCHAVRKHAHFCGALL